MDKTQDFDYEKLNALMQRQVRDSWVNFGSSTLGSGVFVVAALFSEAISGYLGVSEATVMVVAAIPMAIYLIWSGLTWRSRHKDSLAYINALYELQAHCRELETAARNKAAA
jgi:hypothetical protein